MVRQHFHDKGALREQYQFDRMSGRTTEPFKVYKTRIRSLCKRVAPGVADLVVQHLDKRRHTMVDQLSDQIGVICFTAVPTSLLMWAHYAASHTGLVIEFDVAHSVFVQTPRLGPVNYSHLRPILKLGRAPGASLPQAGWEALLTKSLEWKYEAEWRTTTSLKSTQHVVRDGVTEYFAPLPIEAVKSIILGARASDALQRKVLDAVAGADCRHVTVTKARLHAKEYRLEISGPLGSALSLVISE